MVIDGYSISQFHFIAKRWAAKNEAIRNGAQVFRFLEPIDGGVVELLRYINLDIF